MSKEIEIGSLWVDNANDKKVVKVVSIYEKNINLECLTGFVQAQNSFTVDISYFKSFYKPKKLPEQKYFNDVDVQRYYNSGYNNGVEDTVAEFELGNAFTEELEKEAYQDGYKDGGADYLKHTPKSERERALQEEAYEEGFLAAVQEFTDCCDKVGNTEYKFGEIEIVGGSFIVDGCMMSESEFVEWKESFSVSKSIQPNQPVKDERKHSHYFKNVEQFKEIDTYLLARIWNIEDKNGAYFHALKKVLDAGKRGNKGKFKDVQEAIDSLVRYLEVERMFEEES